MVITNGHTTNPPNHRQNRRRERPGSRTRRTLTRKSAFQNEYAEGILDALDYDVQLPSDKTRPSPLLRQNFDQSWQRWKAREAEEKALVLMELERLQVEADKEHLKLFGGDIDDDELLRRILMYDNDPRNVSPFLSAVVEYPISSTSTSSSPSFVVRQAKPRRSRRRPTWHSIPLYLSLSNLRDDNDIARLLAPPPLSSKIQYRPSPPVITTPLSLPTTSAPALSSSFSSAHGSPSISPVNFLDEPPLPSPHSLESPEDWTFITNTTTTTTTPKTDIISAISSPASEPETWILLSDDL